MSKNPPSADKERTRERKARQRLSQPPVTTPIMSQPMHGLVAGAMAEEHRRIDAGVTTPNEVTVPHINPLMAERVLPRRTKGLTPEECGYPEGQVEVHKGPQGQVLWRLRGHYDLPNDILCHNASHELKRAPLLDELKAMFPEYLKVT